MPGKYLLIIEDTAEEKESELTLRIKAREELLDRKLTEPEIDAVKKRVKKHKED